MCLSRNYKGVVLIMAMIFLVIFAALAVSLASMCDTNLQLAHNQHKVNSALCAAESALECGRYIVAQTLPELDSTPRNSVSDDEAEQVWLTLCAQVQLQPWVNGQAQQTADEIITPITTYSENSGSFRIRFYRENTHKIRLEGIGTDKDVIRHVSIEMDITKDNKIMNYAIASRGRMWVTGDSIIHGSIFSDWDNKLPNGNPVSPPQSPFNMTSDSRIEGTINTVISKEDCINATWQLETIDENGDPMFDEYGNRIYSEDDEIQGYHEGINYGQENPDMPGMDISDYDTSIYEDYTDGDVPTPSAQRYYGSDASLEDLPETNGNLYRYERFPHDAGNYTTGSGLSLKRYIYKDQTFTDTRLPDNKNALFINCTFNGVLYVDCSQTSSSYTNNVRFDNCTFNGTIVSDTPQYFNWQRNCLYFTGAATFNNQSSYQEATILAPHFNVNLGNTNPEQSDNNILTGAIVGGIVDVRGNAQVYGTIISMCDTSQWTNGYVTNIGATLGDGGSETTEPGDVGTIEITPDEEKMLPSGITSPIIIRPLQETYSEGF